MIWHARTWHSQSTNTLMHTKNQSLISIVACSFRLRHVIKYYGEGWFNLFKYLVLIKHELECLHHSMIALYQHHVWTYKCCTTQYTIHICMQRFPCIRCIRCIYNNALNVKMATPKIYCFVSICSRMEWTNGWTDGGFHCGECSPILSVWWIKAIIENETIRVYEWVWMVYAVLCASIWCHFSESDKWTRFRAYVRDFS